MIASVEEQLKNIPLIITEFFVRKYCLDEQIVSICKETRVDEVTSKPRVIFHLILCNYFTSCRFLLCEMKKVTGATASKNNTNTPTYS